MGVTANFSFPYPELTDAPDGPSQIEALAGAVDTKLEAVVTGLPFPPLPAYKASDTSRSTTTTLTGDPDLQVGVDANGRYFFWLFLDYEGGTQGASDLKLEWSGPSGTTIAWTPIYIGNAGAQNVGSLGGTTATVVAGTNGSGNKRALVAVGTVFVSSTGGMLELTWAQNSSSGTATVLHGQSAMVLLRMA